MSYALPLVALIAGVCLGGLVAWFLFRAKAAGAAAEARAELQPQVATLTERVSAREQQAKTREEEFRLAQTELNAARQQAAAAANDLVSAGAQLTAERKAHLQLQQEHGETLAELRRLQADLLAQKEQSGTLAEKAKFLQERLAGERQQIETLQQKFQKDFEAVAHKLLVENSSRFGQQSAESLDKLLGPLRENLQDFKSRLDTVHRETVTHTALLKDQIGRIGTEAANLSRALKGDVKVLGNWGENMLDQILAKSGLQLGLHFRRQQAAKDEAGEQRFLDVIVDLPEGKHLIIDSKVSLRSYEDYVNCPDDTQRLKHLEDHILCLRNHVRNLGAKRYQDLLGIDTPDFVLMYIPIEAAFFVAVGREPALFSEALEKNVVLITNSTLLATLRTVANVWRLADQQKYALEIADRGGKLYDKFVGFVQDLQTIGAALKQSQEAWDEANRKLHQGPGNLVGQVEKLKALGVKASKKLPAELTAQIQHENAGLVAEGDEQKETGADADPTANSPG